jgi:hypothetical protein
VVVLLFGFGGFWGYREFVIKQTMPATIQFVSWQRTQSVEIYRWVDDSNQSGCPFNSRSCTNDVEKIGSHQVRTGSHPVDDYSDVTVQDPDKCSTSKNRDGSFTRQCVSQSHTERRKTGSHPVDDYKSVDDFGTVYHFQIQRWVFSRNIDTSGADLNPYWPPASALATAPDPERFSTRSENYNVTFLGADGQSYKWINSDESLWRAFQNQGSKFIIIINGNGRVLYAGLETAAPGYASSAR